MANTKISALTSATTPLAGTEVLPIVQSSTTKQVSIANLTAGRNVATKNTTANATLSPWGSGTTGVFEASGGGLNMALYAAASGLGGLTNNFYTIPGTGDFYAATGTATRYYQYAGTHVLQSAPSGTGGTAITFTNVLETDTSYNVKFSTGNLIQGTAGKGINFTANTGAAGMTSQLLNWYEEGTWTPAVTFGGGSTGLTYSSRSGLYTRVGRIVTCSFDVRLSAKGSSTGAFKVSLPFTAAATPSGDGAVSYITGAATITSLPAASVDAAATTGFYMASAGTMIVLDDTYLTNSSIIICTLSFAV